MCLLRLLRRLPPAPADHVVWIEQDIQDQLKRESALHHPFETGGILLGHRVGREIVVTSLVDPGPRAKHTRWSFDPDGAWQQVELETVFLATHGRVTYLGDWHSHPLDSGLPSGRDRRTAKRIARHHDSQTTEPLMIITGLREGAWASNAWVYVGGALRRAEVRVFRATHPNGDDTAQRP